MSKIKLMLFLLVASNLQAMFGCCFGSRRKPQAQAPAAAVLAPVLAHKQPRVPLAGLLPLAPLHPLFTGFKTEVGAGEVYYDAYEKAFERRDAVEVKRTFDLYLDSVSRRIQIQAVLSGSVVSRPTLEEAMAIDNTALADYLTRQVATERVSAFRRLEGAGGADAC